MTLRQASKAAAVGFAKTARAQSVAGQAVAWRPSKRQRAKQVRPVRPGTGNGTGDEVEAIEVGGGLDQG